MNQQLVGKCLLAAMIVSGTGYVRADDDDDDDDKYSFAVIGDQPYAPTTTTAGGSQVYPALAYERMIANINGDSKVGFAVHVGDIKAGNTLCSDNVYSQNLIYFNSFKKPVMYTPGDNEWTDCHRANNGGMDPLGRLALVRTTFFTGTQSLGQKKRTLIKQAAPYVENSIWVEGPVLFVTLHQPGSNNNKGRTTPPFVDATDAEYTARNAANMAWLNQAFTMAAANSKIRGVVIFSQANPFERFLETATPAYPNSGYADFIANLRSKVQTSGKKVLYVGGDTHYWRVDKPLTDTYPAPTVLAPAGNRLYNFTRTEVFAQNDVHWTKITVDKDNPALFVIEPRIVPGN